MPGKGLNLIFLIWIFKVWIFLTRSWSVLALAGDQSDWRWSFLASTFSCYQWCSHFRLWFVGPWQEAASIAGVTRAWLVYTRMESLLWELTSKHVTLQSISRYLAVYLFIVPLMESDGVGHISLDKWFPIVQHLHSRKKFGLNNLLVPGQPSDCKVEPFEFL